MMQFKKIQNKSQVFFKKKFNQKKSPPIQQTKKPAIYSTENIPSSQHPSKITQNQTLPLLY